MTINPHQPADLAHVLAQQVAALIEQRLHDAIQALDNRAALAGHWQGVADARRAENDRLRQGILEALRYEVEENMQRFSPMADRLRALAGLPPEEPPPITETMAELKALFGHHFDGVDPVVYVEELRGDETEQNRNGEQ